MGIAQALCHPDKKNCGKGLCKDCYNRKNTVRDRTDRAIKHLKRRYGLTPEQYEERVTDQHNLCAICSQPPSPVSPRLNKLVVDHNHESGQLRGLLCSKCNLLLGMAQDDADLLLAARDYLLRYQ